MKKAIVAKNAPGAIGPYSQAIVCGCLIFCAGQVGVDPKTNMLVEGGIVNQTKQTLANLVAVLEAAGSSIENVVKTNVYLNNIDDFAVMNEQYAKHFKKPYPARATIQAAKLPKGALIEMDCIASITNSNEGCADCTCC